MARAVSGSLSRNPPRQRPKNFLDGTTEIQVDQIISCLDQLVRRFGELLRTAAHELSSDRMVVFADLEQSRAELSLENDMLVEHDLGHREFRTEAAGDHTHRPVGKTGKRRLYRRHWNLQRTNREHGWNSTVG